MNENIGFLDIVKTRRSIREFKEGICLLEIWKRHSRLVLWPPLQVTASHGGSTLLRGEPKKVLEAYGPRLGFKYFSKRGPDQRLNLKTFKLPKMEM